jgi:hypothetical protein
VHHVHIEMRASEVNDPLQCFELGQVLHGCYLRVFVRPCAVSIATKTIRGNMSHHRARVWRFDSKPSHLTDRLPINSMTEKGVRHVLEALGIAEKTRCPVR